MESIYKEQVDQLIAKQADKNVNKKLKKLVEESGHDHYVVAKAAEYRYVNNFGAAIDLFKELLDDEDYYDLANYYLGIIYERRGKRDKAIEHFERILHLDGEYAEKARSQYPDTVYSNQEFDTVIQFVEYLEEENLVNANACFNAAKVYYYDRKYKNHQKAEEYAKKAIELDPTVPRYHVFLRVFYQDTKRYEEALKEIDELIALNYKDDKTKLLRPELHMLLHHNGDAIRSIKENVSEGITSDKQDSLYYSLSYQCGDYNNAENLSVSLINGGNFTLEDYKNLMRMYTTETMYYKAMSLYEGLKDDYSFSEGLLYQKVCTLIQMCNYKEAKDIIYGVLNTNNNHVYRRLLALCLYYENNLDEAKEVLKETIADGTKLDIFLRTQLGLDIDNSYVLTETYYLRMTDDYDFDAVYRDIRNRLTSDKKPSRVNANVNIKKFTYEMKDIISAMKPNYTQATDTYLINYGRSVATVNGTPTTHFMVEAIPNGGLLTIKPVIPTVDAVTSYQRVR